MWLNLKYWYSTTDFKNMRYELFVYTMAVVVTVLIIYAIPAAIRTDRECEQKGGVLIRNTCIDKNAVIR